MAETLLHDIRLLHAKRRRISSAGQASIPGGASKHPCSAEPAPDLGKHARTVTLNMWTQRDDTGDTIVRCEAETWKCHAGVLAAASPVMFSMVSGNMKESKDKEIVIKDSVPQAVAAMLQYMYTGEMIKPESAVLVESMKLAHMYNIEGLIQKCGERMLHGLQKENVLVFVRTLRLLCDNPAVAEAYKKVKEKIGSEKDLLDHALDHF
eukprot:TRINITY_DN39440_c0_g1_i1.p1 TRINITY_DN39440_c0_g1~~TRINITY_DN39440_c0_g1_i1.p1  ORF type:complete len:208 (-),score=31.90 TRINITY_DN39440_c0_g1_i1:81-704(-)